MTRSVSGNPRGFGRGSWRGSGRGVLARVLARVRKTGGKRGHAVTKRVLLIEDEPSIMEAIRFLLMREGLRVVTHADGATAVGAVLRSAPDLVILDVMLPNKSGFDVLESLRSDEATAALPVLMLTAKGQSRDRSRANALGASHFMTKPFSNREILDAVNTLLGRG